MRLRVVYVPSSKVAGDFLESQHGLLLVCVKWPYQALKAMVQMVLNQRFFGLLNGLFNCLQLLRNIKAGAANDQHIYRAAQVTMGLFEALDDGWMRCMKERLCHTLY